MEPLMPADHSKVAHKRASNQHQEITPESQDPSRGLRSLSSVSVATSGEGVTLSQQSQDGISRTSLLPSNHPAGDRFRDIVRKVLAYGFMPGDPRAFGSVFKPSRGGGEWRGCKNACQDLDSLVSVVCNPDLTIATRHRFQTRLCAIDLDNHDPGAPVWTRDDPRILALIRAAEGADCAATLVPTPRGLHLWVILPEAVPIVRAHWLIAAICRRAGLNPDGMEIFPSLRCGEDHLGPKARTASQAIRLPGQAGTITGDLFSDPDLIWRTLLEDLGRTALAAASEPWRELLREAADLEAQWKAARPKLTTRPRSFRIDPSARLQAVAWTGKGQSNKHLGALANIGWGAGHRDSVALSSFIETHAQEAEGFLQWASYDTHRRLSRWAREWAACCISKPPSSRTSKHKPSNDPGRNQRLHRQAWVRLLQASQTAAKQFGEGALNWSQRRIAEWSGISRDTLRRLRFHWKVRVSSALWPPRSGHPAEGGTDPCIQGGGVVAVVSSENQSLPSVSSNSGRSPDQNHGLSPPAETGSPPPVMPLRPKVPEPWESAAKIDRERAELARWLGLPA